MWATWVKQKGRFVSTPGSKASLSNYRSPSRDLGVEQNNCASLKVGSGAWRWAKPIRLSCRWTYFTVRSPPPKLALLTMKFTLLSRFTASLETFCNSKWRDGWWDVLVSQIFRQSTRSTRCFVLFVSFYNGSQTKDALVLHTAPRSTKVVWAAAGISPRLSVCFQTYPQVWQRPLRSNPVDLLSTLYFMTLKDEMPSLPSLRSWNNALSFPVWGYRSMISIRGTQTLQNMGLNSDLCFFFFPSEFITCVTVSLCPICRCTAAGSAAVYIRATGRLPDAEGLTVYQRMRVLNTGARPPSWPWYWAVRHWGLEQGWGWEVDPDSGHLTQVGLLVFRDNLGEGRTEGTGLCVVVGQWQQQWAHEYARPLFSDFMPADVNEPCHSSIGISPSISAQPEL